MGSAERRPYRDWIGSCRLRLLRFARVAAALPMIGAAAVELKLAAAKIRGLAVVAADATGRGSAGSRDGESPRHLCAVPSDAPVRTRLPAGLLRTRLGVPRRPIEYARAIPRDVRTTRAADDASRPPRRVSRGRLRPPAAARPSSRLPPLSRDVGSRRASTPAPSLRCLTASTSGMAARSRRDALPPLAARSTVIHQVRSLLAAAVRTSMDRGSAIMMASNLLLIRRGLALPESVTVVARRLSRPTTSRPGPSGRGRPSASGAVGVRRRSWSFALRRLPMFLSSRPRMPSDRHHGGPAMTFVVVSPLRVFRPGASDRYRRAELSSHGFVPSVAGSGRRRRVVEPELHHRRSVGWTTGMSRPSVVTGDVGTTQGTRLAAE